MQVVHRDRAVFRRDLSLVESLARDGGLEIDVSAEADSADQIESWIDSGVSRVVLGARALADERLAEVDGRDLSQCLDR